MQNKTTQWLNRQLVNSTPEQALAKLTEEFGIKVSSYEDSLFVLNYDQIKSPKTHSITKECRSLVVYVTFVGDINYPEFEVVSRSFDRFYNAGEVAFPHKIEKMTAHEKMDGSLVTVWYDDSVTGEWLYRTRSMIMPENEINAWNRTWKDLIETSLGWDTMCYLDREWDFIFEVTGEENRVVVRYPEDRKATLLAIRKKDGSYLSDTVCDSVAKDNGWERPRRYEFDSLEHIQEAAANLPNLEEGYVMYYKGKPIGKIKNPAYVAAHHLRGEGLNPKRCLDLVIMGEIEEYIAVFPEDAHKLTSHRDLLERTIRTLNLLFAEHSHLTNQKDFALAVVPLMKGKVSSCLFSMKRGDSALEAFNKLSTKAKYSLLEYLL